MMASLSIGMGGHEIPLDGLGDRAEEFESLFDRELFDGLLEFGDLQGGIGRKCATLWLYFNSTLKSL